MQIYNFRVGDMLYHDDSHRTVTQDKTSITGVIYKVTPKYVYYAICAGPRSGGPAFISKDNKVKKEKIINALRDGLLNVSYGGGTSRRRKQ